MIALYLLATIALLVGSAAIYMALLKPFPVQWLYYHYFVRKPLVWTMSGGSLAYVTWLSLEAGSFPMAAAVPLALIALAVVLTYRMHQNPLSLQLTSRRCPITHSSFPSQTTCSLRLSSTAMSPRLIRWTM